MMALCWAASHARTGLTRFRRSCVEPFDFVRAPAGRWTVVNGRARLPTNVSFDVLRALRAGEAAKRRPLARGGQTYLAALTSATRVRCKTRGRLCTSLCAALRCSRARGDRERTAIQKSALSPKNSVALQD